MESCGARQWLGTEGGGDVSEEGSGDGLAAAGAMDVLGMATLCAIWRDGLGWRGTVQWVFEWNMDLSIARYR
jgi:hypothetical protein